MEITCNMESRSILDQDEVVDLITFNSHGTVGHTVASTDWRTSDFKIKHSNQHNKTLLKNLIEECFRLIMLLH
jgi:hypothetical protein